MKKWWQRKSGRKANMAHWQIIGPCIELHHDWNQVFHSGTNMAEMAGASRDDDKNTVTNLQGLLKYVLSHSGIIHVDCFRLTWHNRDIILNLKQAVIASTAFLGRLPSLAWSVLWLIHFYSGDTVAQIKHWRISQIILLDVGEMNQSN